MRYEPVVKRYHADEAAQLSLCGRFGERPYFGRFLGSRRHTSAGQMVPEEVQLRHTHHTFVYVELHADVVESLQDRS